MEGGWRDSRGEDDRQEGHEDLGAGGYAPCRLILPDLTPTQRQRPGFPQLHALRPHTTNRPVTHLLPPAPVLCVQASASGPGRTHAPSWMQVPRTPSRPTVRLACLLSCLLPETCVPCRGARHVGVYLVVVLLPSHPLTSNCLPLFLLLSCRPQAGLPRRVQGRQKGGCQAPQVCRQGQAAAAGS